VRRQQRTLAAPVQPKLSNPVDRCSPASRASSPDVRAAIRRVWINEVKSKRNTKSNPNVQKQRYKNMFFFSE
jgi:hypothetical protein